jgi:hypothetical protein
MSVVMKGKDSFLLIGRYGLVNEAISLAVIMKRIGVMEHTPAYYARRLGKKESKELRLNEIELNQIVDESMKEAQNIRDEAQKQYDKAISSYKDRTLWLQQIKNKANFNV